MTEELFDNTDYYVVLYKEDTLFAGIGKTIDEALQEANSIFKPEKRIPSTQTIPEYLDAKEDEMCFAKCSSKLYQYFMNLDDYYEQIYYKNGKFILMSEDTTMVTIDVFEVAGKNCVMNEDGEKIYNLILKEFDNKHSVKLDFTHVIYYASGFFNTAIGRLLDKYTQNDLRQNLFFEGLSEHGDYILKKCIQNAIKYYLNKNADIDNIVYQLETKSLAAYTNEQLLEELSMLSPSLYDLNFKRPGEFTFTIKLKKSDDLTK